jgi:hypothetical protein
VQTHGLKIIAELERLIDEARGCLSRTTNTDSRSIWQTFLERLEKRKQELMREIEQR